MHSLRHALEKKALSLLLAAMAVWGRHEFFSLRNGERSKELWKHGSQGAPKPDVKEVRKIGVADIVVVRRICAFNSQSASGYSRSRCVCLIGGSSRRTE